MAYIVNTSLESRFAPDVECLDDRSALSAFNIEQSSTGMKEGDLRLHPLVTRLVDGETLEKMGAKKVGD